MEIKKTYTTGVLSFNKIILKPIVSDLFIKSISVISIDGEVVQLDVQPFSLEGDTSVNNPVGNCIALILSVEHDSLESEDQLAGCLHVDVSKSSNTGEALIITKPVRVSTKDAISIVSKLENSTGVILSADVGIVGYSNDDEEIFNDSVRIGLGYSREILSSGENTLFKTSSIRAFSDGIVSSESINAFDNKIHNYSKQYKYLCTPEYTQYSSKTKITDNISIDNNNIIYIDSKVCKYAAVSLRVEVLDTENSAPLIKYLGVISR